MRGGRGGQRNRAFAMHFLSERRGEPDSNANFALATTRRATARCRRVRTLGSRTSYPGNSGMSVTRLMAARGVRHGAVASDDPPRSLLVSWHKSLSAPDLGREFGVKLLRVKKSAMFDVLRWI
jgi:hypothetical protein